jgi:hemin uptake protein HemP
MVPFQQPQRPPTCDPQSPRRVILSETLLQGTREIVIAHNGQCYRLLVQKRGGLILQK